MDMPDLECPARAPEWGRVLIDNLKKYFGEITTLINSNFDVRFGVLEQSVDGLKTTADMALTLAQKNKTNIDDFQKKIQQNLDRLNVKCESLENENEKLKKQTINMENYSRRNNLVVRGIPETTKETKTQCESKVKDFLKQELKLDADRVGSMKFVRIHRLGKLPVDGQAARPMIIRFCYFTDKTYVWDHRKNISQNHLYISENFARDTEYNRNKLYPIYKRAKSMVKYQKVISLNGDVLLIDSIPYTVNNLEKLPQDLSARISCEKSDNKTLAFGGILSEHSPFSNWFNCDMKYKGHNFHSVEQAYQYAKAIQFNDNSTALKLQYAQTPSDAKQLGWKVSGFKKAEWENIQDGVMKELLMLKFSDPVLARELRSTGTKVLVEAGLDEHYAAGLRFTSKSILVSAEWKGENMLGKLLCDVRSGI